MSSLFFKVPENFKLENGELLPEIQLRYHFFGDLNEEGNNVIWIFHALTANSNPYDWWNYLLINHPAFNLNEHFIICVNMPGSCYGSIGPLSINITTHQPYFHQFPRLTNRDVIQSFQLLKQHLGITKIQLGMGGSLGGQQLLEWAIIEPDLFETIIPLATNAKHSPWGIAFNASQRWAIENDPSWKSDSIEAGMEGLKIARSIALLSYRTPEIYNKMQADDLDHINLGQQFQHKAITYQHYQGNKLANRFNAYSYYLLTQMMDTHDLGRGRGGLKSALTLIKAKVIVISIHSDILFPVKDQSFLADHITDAKHVIIESPYGHDGFLVETEVIGKIMSEYLYNTRLVK